MGTISRPSVKPRPRGCPGKDVFYQKGSVLDAEENRELEFKSLASAQLCCLPWKIMEKGKTFICACLNNDRKGTIYFGIGDSQEQGSKYKHGEIIGLKVEGIKDRINKGFQAVLDGHIKSDVGPLQKGGDQNCINIHFVPVRNQGNCTDLYVIEIEVTREWRFCKDKVYYTKSWTEKREADKDCIGKEGLSDYYKVRNKFDDVAIRTNGVSSCVQHQDVYTQVKKPLKLKYKEWKRKDEPGLPQDIKDSESQSLEKTIKEIELRCRILMTEKKPRRKKENQLVYFDHQNAQKKEEENCKLRASNEKLKNDLEDLKKVGDLMASLGEEFPDHSSSGFSVDLMASLGGEFPDHRSSGFSEQASFHEEEVDCMAIGCSPEPPRDSLAEPQGTRCDDTTQVVCNQVE